MCVKQLSYGYDDGMPCVLLKINKVMGSIFHLSVEAKLSANLSGVCVFMINQLAWKKQLIVILVFYFLYQT